MPADDLEIFCGEAVHVARYWVVLSAVQSTLYPDETLGCCQPIVRCCDFNAARREAWNVTLNGFASLLLLLVVLHSTWLLMSLPAVGAQRSRAEVELLVFHFRAHFLAVQCEFLLALFFAFLGVNTVFSFKVRYQALAFSVSVLAPIGLILLGTILISVLATTVRTRGQLLDKRRLHVALEERRHGLERLEGAADIRSSLKMRMGQSPHVRVSSLRRRHWAGPQGAAAEQSISAVLRSSSQIDGCGQSHGGQPLSPMSRRSLLRRVVMGGHAAHAEGRLLVRSDI